MKILHYSLGFPPYRTGGLTKYCVDLMLTQKEQGNEVALLWPGQMGFINKKIKIKERTEWNEIGNFEIINPLPISLDEGILEVGAFTTRVDGFVYKSFLQKYKPDVIHIHTLMGLHCELIEIAKELNISTVFTAHDYFGICPKVTLFHEGKTCDNNNNCANCAKCNNSALSMKKIALMQSVFYRKLKNTKLVKKMRQQHRTEFYEQRVGNKTIDILTISLDASQYQNLRKFYITMLKNIGKIHFNSTLTEKIYKRYISHPNTVVKSISHRGIMDNKKIKSFDNEKLRITYLGPAKSFKGFNILLSALDKVWENNVGKFELHIYSPTCRNRPYITVQGNGYQYCELENIFDKTDLLVAPSVWYETYGFTVLEALSYGVPVIVTENVGAKDLLKETFGIICDTFDGDIKDKINILINTSKCEDMNKMIVNEFNIPRIENFDYSLYTEGDRK